MEEEDELVPDPDDKGCLNLSNRAWVHLDAAIWTMSTRLVKLDISYNHILELPSQIGELVMLRELLASFNKINQLPAEIGMLKRLRRLVLNSNRIKVIPIDIGQLEMLEELILSENSIEEIPQTIAMMTNLKVVKVSNNRLRSIPFELADVMTLEEIDCGNNPNLDMIPAKWRGDTDSVLFTCRVHRDYNVRMSEMVRSNQELSRHSQFAEQECLVAKERGALLLAQIDELKKNMPKNILRRIEADAKKSKEQELGGEDKDRSSATSISSNCSIS